jgi:hypothetical protein
MGDEIIDEGLPIEQEDVEQKARDKVTKEIGEIRRRRSKTEKKRFLTNKEDYVLFAGIGYGAIFALVIFCMSSGIFGSSTTLDHKASETALDTGEECENIDSDTWIHMFPENDLEYFSLAGHNLPPGFALMNYTITEIGNEGWNGITDETVKKVDNDKVNYQAPYQQ